MRRLVACFGLLFAALAAPADESPSVELFAGWAWAPYPYAGYPYPYGGPCPPIPCAGVIVPVYGREGPRDLYGTCGYAPFWGFGSGVRIPLRDRRVANALSAGTLAPAPGSAPCELRDPQHEKDWERDIQAFLGAVDPETWRPSGTNAVPQASSATR